MNPHPSKYILRFIAVLLLALCVAGSALAQSPDSLTDQSDGNGGLRPQWYTSGPASFDGTGIYYLGRELACVMDHRGAAWMERPERERTELPAAVVRNLELSDDAVVADIGAGTGYFTFRIASEVPQGRVLAVDIQPTMLDIIERRASVDGATNVETVLGTETSPGLEAESVDLTLISDAYHEFSRPREMAQAIFDATRPGGRLVLIEYRAEDPTVPILELHKMSEAQARREMEAVGFRFVENRDFLPQQHFLVFEREG